jgi:hypothetical protein
MSYKSNREMRAESLADEQRNYERNRAAYERRKSKNAGGVNWLLIIVIIIVAFYFVRQQRGMMSPGKPVIRPVASHVR